MTIKNDWLPFYEGEIQKDYYKKLEEFLELEYKTETIYPTKTDLFRAFELTSYSDVKVVIIGQDPYHGENQAHGLCFSVKRDIRIPPSLRNIYKTLVTDCNCTVPTHGNLTQWAEQGVFLLNTVLTVRAGQAASHQKKGWEHFTDHAISYLNERQTPIVFLLWGAHAHKKEVLITAPQHLVLKSVHPSPLSARRGFFECEHFSKSNTFLMEHHMTPINWQIKD